MHRPNAHGIIEGTRFWQLLEHLSGRRTESPVRHRKDTTDLLRELDLVTYRGDLTGPAWALLELLDQARVSHDVANQARQAQQCPQRDPPGPPQPD